MFFFCTNGANMPVFFLCLYKACFSPEKFYLARTRLLHHPLQDQVLHSLNEGDEGCPDEGLDIPQAFETIHLFVLLS